MTKIKSVEDFEMARTLAKPDKSGLMCRCRKCKGKGYNVLHASLPNLNKIVGNNFQLNLVFCDAKGCSGETYKRLRGDCVVGSVEEKAEQST